VVLEHPTGSMEAVITTAQDEAGAPTIAAGGTLRTARLLMKGEIFVPSRIWAGKGP
jgi:2-methylaconitate cis-trans-isomerase PrpF